MLPQCLRPGADNSLSSTPTFRRSPVHVAPKFDILEEITAKIKLKVTPEPSLIRSTPMNADPRRFDRRISSCIGGSLLQWWEAPSLWIGPRRDDKELIHVFQHW